MRWRRERKGTPNFISKRAKIESITETTKAKTWIVQLFELNVGVLVVRR